MSRPRTMTEVKAADCWAVGVIAYILITGGPPFNGENKEQIFSNICNKKRKLRFPKGVTASFKSFVRSLLSRDIKQRMTAAQALEHPWICGDVASTDRLGASYLQSLQKFNRGNKLQNILVNACIERATTTDKHAMEKGLLDMHRARHEVRDSDVVDYLLLHTKVTEQELHNVTDTLEQKESDDSSQNLADQLMAVVDDVMALFSTATKEDLPSENPTFSKMKSAPQTQNYSMSLEVPDGRFARANSAPNPYPVEASNEEKHTRRISGHRFSAIMSATPYDVTALMEDLVDSDGMIPLDDIAQYDMRSDAESESEIFWE